MNKKVSIGVAVYNGETTLKRAIDSLINQTYKNIEIIIIDDYSIDGSPSIIKKYANEDSRIIYKINKINKEFVNNFNELFNMSNGDYFLWSDQDDYREKTFIGLVVPSFLFSENTERHAGFLWTRSTGVSHGLKSI